MGATPMTGFILSALLGLVLAGGWMARRRVRRAVRGERLVVTDEVLRRILSEGAAGDGDDAEDEPLDLPRIREAEDRFLDEAEWDEPEPFG